MKTKPITEGTTIAELGVILNEADVADVDARCTAGGYTVGFVLRALRGPEGRVCVRSVSGDTLAMAFQNALDTTAKLINVRIQVRDAAGVLRGAYPCTNEGRSHAERHMRSLGRGASVK